MTVEEAIEFLKSRKLGMKKITYKEFFKNLKQGSVVKLTKHPKFDLTKNDIYLLRIKLIKTQKYDYIGVNLKTGMPWDEDHLDDVEFEIIKNNEKTE